MEQDSETISFGWIYYYLSVVIAIKKAPQKGAFVLFLILSETPYPTLNGTSPISALSRLPICFLTSLSEA